MSYKCEQCDAVLEDKYEPMGWVWFTGYLSRTHHYCPIHSRSESSKKKLIESRAVPIADTTAQGGE